MNNTTGISNISLPLVLIMCALICCTSGKDSHDDVPLVRVGYNVQSLNYGPIMAAIEKNMFDQLKCRIEFIPVESGREVRQGIAAGHFDIGSASVSDFISPIAAGAPVSIIAPLAVTTTLLFVRPDSLIRTFDDLKGKKIRGGRGGHSEFIFKLALKKEGVDISDVEFVPIEHAFRGVALVGKKAIDAVPMSFYGMIDLQKYGAVVHEEWLKKGYSDTYWLNAVIAVNTNFLQRKPHIVREILEVIVEAHRYIAENKEESARKISKHINENTHGVGNLPSEEILKVWEHGVRYTLWCKSEILEEMSTMLFETGMIKRSLAIEDIYDSRFESELKSSHMEIYESQN